MKKNLEKTRILGRKLARELSVSEIEAVSGGNVSGTTNTWCDHANQCHLDDSSLGGLTHGPGESTFLP